MNVHRDNAKIALRALLGALLSRVGVEPTDMERRLADRVIDETILAMLLADRVIDETILAMHETPPARRGGP